MSEDLLIGLLHSADQPATILGGGESGGQHLQGDPAGVFTVRPEPVGHRVQDPIGQHRILIALPHRPLIGGRRGPQHRNHARAYTTSGAKVGSFLPDFQCLSSAWASSRYAIPPLLLRPASTEEPEALASANRTVRGIGGASTGSS